MNAIVIPMHFPVMAKIDYQIKSIFLLSANHANFFSRFSHPLLSRKVTEWREQVTVREKQEMFKPLERHIARELAVQQLDLLASGMHGDTGKRQELETTLASKFMLNLCSLLLNWFVLQLQKHCTLYNCKCGVNSENVGWLFEGEIDFLSEEERIEPEQYVAAAMVRLLVTAGI